jgi:hypothetical protein
MDAAPILRRLAELLNRHGLEAIMIGNAAAALQGAPVTTVDIDFFFPKTPANIKRLKAVSAELKGVILRPFHPVVDDLFRIMRDHDTCKSISCRQSRVWNPSRTSEGARLA